LILNGVLLASHVNKEQVLTLPDILARRYGPVVETVVSSFAVITLLMLIAGNMERCAKIASYLWDTSPTASLWIVALCIWLITVSGGLVSSTSTSVVQGVFGWGGCVLTFAYVIAQQYPSASPPSIGFPGKTAANVFRPPPRFEFLTDCQGISTPTVLEILSAICTKVYLAPSIRASAAITKISGVQTGGLIVIDMIGVHIHSGTKLCLVTR
jgi:Na+/proline symporter